MMEWVIIPGNLLVTRTPIAHEDYDGGDASFVDRVSWFDAIAWCNRVSMSLGLDPVYVIDGVPIEAAPLPILNRNKLRINLPTMRANANGLRLPTAAEWKRITTATGIVFGERSEAQEDGALIVTVRHREWLGDRAGPVLRYEFPTTAFGESTVECSGFFALPDLGFRAVRTT